jgi:cytochrome c oxidase subunit 2
VLSRSLVAAVAVAAVALAGCQAISPPTAATVEGRSVDSLYQVLLVIAILIFLLVEGLLTVAILRYRRRDDSLPPQVHGHRGLEIAWTVIPSLLVLGVFLLSMQTLGTVDARTANPDVIVDVMGRQWFWDFSYEKEGIHVSGAGKTPEITLPVDEQIRFVLTSDNVIHSFYIPQFLFKRDDIPGARNTFEIRITDPGTYGGQCAEFCGLGHATMQFRIRAVPPAEYATWVAQQQAAASASAAASSASPGASGAAASLPPGAPTLDVSAASPAGFDQASLAAPAGQAFAIHFANNDPSVPHDVAIRDASGKTVFQGDIITGPADATYTVGALQAGTYTFFCIVHPNMQGTLTVR